MKIKWLGHASFLITSEAGVKIITDPYTTTPNLTYGEIRESANIVTVSHEHSDHNNVAAVRGNPEVVRKTAKAKGIDFKGVSTFHDSAEGRQRGKNTIFCFEVDGMRVCHIGDLGHPLSDKQVAELGKVDILLIPVGGGPTISPSIATEVCNKLTPKVIIPMHFRNEKCSIPSWGVDEFLKGKAGVSKLNTSEAEFKPGKLPATTQIIVLKPAL